MFDSLYVPCACGEEVEFQSKAGDCALERYTLSNCPPRIAGDLIGQSQTCRCGKSEIILRGAVVLVPEHRS